LKSEGKERYVKSRRRRENYTEVGLDEIRREILDSTFIEEICEQDDRLLGSMKAGRFLTS
jgi:hypothetical protein